MSTSKEGGPFPNPEANIFGAVFNIAPAQLSPKAETQRQQEVRNILNYLPPDERFTLWELVGNGRKLFQVAEDLADIKGRRISSDWAQRLKDKALKILKSLPDSDNNLAVFLPYEESHLGKSLWAVDYGYQLLSLLSPVDIRRLRLTNLPVLSETKAELEDKFPHRDYQKIRVVPFLRRDADRYSELARADIKQSLVALQKRAKR